MAILDVEICGVAIGVEDRWTKVLVGANALVGANVLARAKVLPVR
jgi:hypothetical protein